MDTQNQGGTPLHEADYLVTGCILTMQGGAIHRDGAIAISGDTIAAVGPRPEVMRNYRGRQSLGGPSAIVMPGMIDCHTHCTACFTRSLAAGELPMIPRIYNPAQRCHTAAETKSAIRLITAQLLRSGVTTMCEGSLIPAQEQPMLEAIDEIGIRCNFARGTPDQDYCHAALYDQIRNSSWIKPRPNDAAVDLKKTAALLESYPPRGRQLIRGAITVSALTGFSEHYFREASALARQHDSSVQVHVDRDREEVEFSLSLWGRRPIERLADLGVLDERLVAIHAVLANHREIGLLGEARSSFAHSPIEAVCNLNAVPNLQQFRSAGVTVGLGCDNQANDMFETMRAAWLIHGAMWGIASYDPEYLTANEILAMATIEAAKALRMDDLIGSLVPGKAADLVILDGDAPHLMPMQDVAVELVRYATRAEITDVMVNGKPMVSDGMFTNLDLQELRTEVDAAGRRVRDTVSGRRYRPMPTLAPWL